MRQRGFLGLSTAGQLVVLLVAAAGAISAGWAAVSWHARTHFDRGEASMKLKWEQANREAEEEAELTRLEVETAIGVLQGQRQAAEARAQRAGDLWKEARRDAQRRGEDLAVCEAGWSVASARGAGDREPAGVVAERGPDLGAAPRALLTWRFVYLYDAAWTSLAGEPLPGAPEGAQGAAGAGAPSPYDAGELLDVHAENARRCSEDRRELAGLIAKIEAAAEAFDRRAAR